MKFEEGKRWLACKGYKLEKGKWTAAPVSESRISASVEISATDIDMWRAVLKISLDSPARCRSLHEFSNVMGSPGAAIESVVEMVPGALRRKLKKRLGHDPLICRELQGDLVAEDGIRWLRDGDWWRVDESSRSISDWHKSWRGEIEEDEGRRWEWQTGSSIWLDMWSSGHGWRAGLEFKIEGEDFSRELREEMSVSLSSKKILETPRAALMEIFESLESRSMGKFWELAIQDAKRKMGLEEA